MKVYVNWGPRNTSATYRVKGADLEGALEFLKGREEWGKFDDSFTYKWKGDAQANVSSVSLAPTFTITMPSWSGYRNQPQTCKDAWDAMWRALRKHEDGHRGLFESGIANLVGSMEALEAPTGRDVDDIMKGARSDLQAAHDKYDTETDHGSSQGVELTVSQQCRSKAKAD